MSPSGALRGLELGELLLPAGHLAPLIVALQPLVPPARRGTRSAPHGTSAEHLERDARDLEEVLLHLGRHGDHGRASTTGNTEGTVVPEAVELPEAIDDRRVIDRNETAARRVIGWPALMHGGPWSEALRPMRQASRHLARTRWCADFAAIDELSHRGVGTPRGGTAVASNNGRTQCRSLDVVVALGQTRSRACGHRA